MEEVDREISEMKLSLNARARVVAESYLTAVCTSLRALPAEPYLFPVYVMILSSFRNVWRVVVTASRALLYRIAQCKLGSIWPFHYKSQIEYQKDVP